MVHRDSSAQIIDTERLEAFLDRHGSRSLDVTGKVIHVVNQVPFECELHLDPGHPLSVHKTESGHPLAAKDWHSRRVSSLYGLESAPISHLARRRSTIKALGESAYWRLLTRRGHSAMYAGIDSLKSSYRNLYVGGTGNIHNAEGEVVNSEDLTEEQRSSLYTLLQDKHDMVPIFIDSDTATHHYEDFCKKILWPMLHYRMWNDPIDDKVAWDAYVKVNRIFAQTVAEHYRPGDLVWIHDYHLLLVPEMLRDMLSPDALIGLFVHTPFPSSEIFRCLPRRRDILMGMLGSSLIGFQTYNYARHFSSNCTRILGYEYTPSGIDANGVNVAIDIYPIGIDTDRTRYNCNRPGVAPKAEAIRKKYADKRIIVGRDKLDPVKGVLQKLESFEKFLNDYPEWQGKVVLIQVTSPGVVDSPRLEQKAAELVCRINSKFGSLEFTPVNHYHQHIDRDEYYALLEVADVGLFTPVSDGMNTASLEFIVAQENKYSPLILSEFAGTAHSMSASVIVNPWDYAGVARAIAECLTMSDMDKCYKYTQLHAFVTSHTAAYWAKSFVKGLMSSNVRRTRGPTSRLSNALVRREYDMTARRLFFLDYDGTLTPIRESPEEAVPSESMLANLARICSDPKNIVWVVSGRDREALERWLGGIPRLGLSSEHGCFIRDPGSSKWIDTTEQIDMSWKEDVRHIFEYYTERTPGSFVEEKECAITWHYRKADPKFGAFQAKECLNHIEQSMLGKQPVETLVGKMNLEVRPTAVNKGEVIKRALSQNPLADFVLCAGDDKTDEDMFAVLQRLQSTTTQPRLRFSITIGEADKQTKADFHIDTSEEFVDMLGDLTQ